MASAVLRRTLQLIGEAPREKDPAAVVLGRRGGLKGGKVRMASLTAAEQWQKLADKRPLLGGGNPTNSLPSSTNRYTHVVGLTADTSRQ